MAKDSKKTKLLDWSRIRKLPVEMYQSIRGPIMGHAQHISSTCIRIWAPAWTGFDGSKRTWLPLDCCEEYLDIDPRSAAFFGTNPVPDIVALGYTEYVNEFMKGSYKMKPVVAEMRVDGTQVMNVDSRIPPVPAEAPLPERTAVCGSCGAEPGSDHKDSCATLKARSTCAACNHPGHPGQQCMLPLLENGQAVTCGCMTHVPRLSSVSSEPTIAPVTVGDTPTSSG